MKSIFSQISKFSLLNHAKRLAMAVVFLSFAAIATAMGGGGSDWEARFYVNNVQLANGATGSGTVYFENVADGLTLDTRYGGKDKVNLSPNSVNTNFFHVYNTAVSENTSQQIKGDLRAEAAGGSFFEGWTHEPISLTKHSSDHTLGDNFTPQTYTPIINDKIYTFNFTMGGYAADTKCALDQNTAIYAKFTAKTYLAKSPVVGVYFKDSEGNYTENAGGTVAVTWDGNTTPNYATSVASTDAEKQGNGVDDEATITFSYHVQETSGFHFVGWATSIDDQNYATRTDNPMQVSIVTNWSINDTESSEIPQAPTYYAIFESSQQYYYQGIRAEVSGELSGAEVRFKVNDENFTEYGSPYVEDNQLRSMVDKNAFSVTYEVNVTEPTKVAFKGWSVQPGSGNYVSTATTYPETYSTYVTNSAEPYSPPTVYAIMQSNWYQNPTVRITDSSNGMGQVAWSYVEEEPSIAEWKYDIDGSATPLNQVAAADGGHLYTIYYYARPLNGAKFVGWANANDPTKLVTDERENPYKVSCTASSIDKDNPYIPDFLYAVFQSNIDVMHQDDMICYVDQHGNANVNDANVIVDMGSVNQLHAELLTNTDIFTLTDQYGINKGDAIDAVSNEGMTRFVVTYDGNNPQADALAQKTAQIRLTTADGGETTITVKIKPVPVVTFLPTYGKASYTIKHTDGSSIGYEMEKEDTENIYISIMQESMSILELNLNFTPTETMDFKGWQVSTDQGSKIISSEKIATYRFTESSVVQPVFMTKGSAIFTILSDSYNEQYQDLHLALEVAQSRFVTTKQEQVVVFSNGGNQEAVLPYGDYVIPNGVTLLIPGVGPGDGFNPISYEKDFEDEKYIYRVKDVGKVPNTDVDADVVLLLEDYSRIEGAPVCYRKLKVEDNTTITVEPGGSINMYAYLTSTSAQTYEARPFRYGWIELGNNCQIILQESTNAAEKAELYAFGYITGPNNSRVIANAGAEVHELLQYTEVRGGTGTADLFLNRDKNKVFPINQFYAQNIEVPLEIKYGAAEYVTTTANMLGGSEYVMMSGLIVPDQSAYATGFVRIADGMSLIKEYDTHRDRLQITIEGSGNAQAKIGYINVQMGDLRPTLQPTIDSYLAGLEGWMQAIARPVINGILSGLSNVQLNSADYVMPIPSNMDIVLNSAKLTVPYDVAWLAGSTMKIDESSILTINQGAKVYIYDSEEAILPEANWDANKSKYAVGTGYFSHLKAVLQPISYTPNNDQFLLKADGTIATSTDVTHIRTTTNTTAGNLYKRQMKELDGFDGELVTGDAQWLVNGQVIVNGGIYTTAGNARIISNAEGKVQFASQLAATTTKQAKYKGGGAAVLINGDGAHDYVEFPVNSARLRNADGIFVSTVKDTYTYSPVEGRWLTAADQPSGEVEGEIITVTLPEQNKQAIIEITSDLITSAEGITATIAWNGMAAENVGNITFENGALKIPLVYVPVNKAGEYEGILTISAGGNTIVQRIVVIEDYTPQFSVTNPVTLTAPVGHTITSTTANFQVTPAIENVANTIRQVDNKYKAQWTYNITGDNADEFQFQWGEGDNMFTQAVIKFTPNTAEEKNALLSLTATYTDDSKQKHVTSVAIPLIGVVQALSTNTLAFAQGVEQLFRDGGETRLFQNVANNNTNPITITTTPESQSILSIPSSGDVNMMITPTGIGSLTVTATQDADLVHGVAATSITKTITVSDNIVWNWEHLYFGSINENPVTTLYNAYRVKLIAESDTFKVVSDFDGNTVKIANWETGETKIKFNVIYTDGGVEKSKEFSSLIYRDPRELSIYLNDERIYEAITLNTNLIRYNPNTSSVHFQSTTNEVAQWTLYFMGIPDKLSFTASGNNNWQIEESSNGTNWSVAHTWATIKAGTEFDLSLKPSTNYVRISYSTSDPASSGSLSNVAITELISVKADVEKLYMPIISPSSTKSVVFTYVSADDLTLQTNYDVFTPNPNKLLKNTQEPFYMVKRVDLTSTAQSEIGDGLLSVLGTNTAVGIRTYTYPQSIPIQLASDKLERYYFVTSESYNTHWTNEDATRAVVMRNAVADAAPYVVFHFADAPAPGVISFNYSGVGERATWIVQESEDGTQWIDLTTNPAESKGLVMRNFDPTRTARYVRVIYDCDYAGVVELTNVSILPTTSVVVDPSSLTVFSDKNEILTLMASNLYDIQFDIYDMNSNTSTDFQIVNKQGTILTKDELNTLFASASQGTVKESIYVKYAGISAITYGVLKISTNYSPEGTKLAVPELLATVELTGINRNLPIGETGIFTGVGAGYTIRGTWDGSTRRPVNSQHAFANGQPLFDYVIIYGETKTTDGVKTISTPTSTAGSNAQTPCYIYKKSGNNYILEDLTYFVENANSSSKSYKGAISISDVAASDVDNSPEQLRVYITGFCPYASTGYSKSDEGVWYFKGDAGDKIDIYLEDCYIYSRYKSKRGNAFTRESGESYSDKVARGSGAVLLFECNTQKEVTTTPLEVTIHTRQENLLKSHYGCLFESIVGRAFQISSPIQIGMQTANHYLNSFTTLTFDDKWPTATTVDANGDFTTIERTNGFLSLQKQVNNAPSIDMGNAKTVVNFRGGHIELQNACISSDNYESSLAISYRTGMYGPSKFRFTLSHGIGTDGVEGTVKFYDGTTSVLPMTVPERFRQYYLMDTDANGNELTTTSCLRTPQNTYVYGGSHCMMRACSAPTSKGGAPTDGATGKPLGKFEYTQDMGWNANGTYGLVTPTKFPDECLTNYYTTASGYENSTYGLQSVTPVNGKLNFWIPDLDCSEFDVKPEVDQAISFWKASMTLIEANYGVYSGSVGGSNVEIAMDGTEQKEQVQNLLYCKIDDNISGIITATGEKQYTAHVLNPAPDGGYIDIAPTTVGPELQNSIQNEAAYQIEDKVYYVTTIPQADIWMNFTAPFDVEKIYVVETYDEDVLAAFENREEILAQQAIHNADFAAFFGVAIALESKKTFDLIYRDYLGWVREQDGSTDKRGMKQLQHYYETYDAEGKYESSNWRDADYYLYKNTDNWTLNVDGDFTTQWGYIPVNITQPNGQVLLEQGETYSMMFPYCTGCWKYDDKKGYYRDDWDYWSGKFIIFESTQGPHIIQGSNYMASAKPATGEWAFDVTVPENEAKLMGNATFAQMDTKNEKVYSYSVRPMKESYDPIDPWGTEIEPTATFLLSNFTGNQMPTRVSRTGEIIYDKENTPTGNIPTVGGGNDLFITSTMEGINIAVAEPQYVRVLSSTGAVLYSGMVQTAVDVALPTTGVYVITGENEVHKILH